MAAVEDGHICSPTNQIYLNHMLKKRIKSLLAHPLTHGMDIDSPEMTIRRSIIVRQKGFLKCFYQKCYRTIAELLPNRINGPVLEIGSGGGFLKECISGLLTAEILHIPSVDVICDAQNLPFKPASLRAIVMLDVLHHIPHVKSFLATSARCVKPGGKIVLIEPWNTRWSQFVYKYLHHEPFDQHTGQWKLPSSGPLSQANSALPWIVFERDREIFEQEFPYWQIERSDLHSPLSYLMSGGISYRVSLPSILFKPCIKFENFLKPWMSFWAMFATIVLTRKSDQK
jgi:SAM-dependent methyltransferase